MQLGARTRASETDSGASHPRDLDIVISLSGLPFLMSSAFSVLVLDICGDGDYMFLLLS